MSKDRKKFLIYALVLIVIRACLVNVIPIRGLADADVDDYLMINLQKSMYHFDWLGDFSALTFAKGVTFPLFLAIICRIGISYIDALSILYSCACLMFIYVIKDIVKNKDDLYIIFALM